MSNLDYSTGRPAQAEEDGQTDRGEGIGWPCAINSADQDKGLWDLPAKTIPLHKWPAVRRLF